MSADDSRDAHKGAGWLAGEGRQVGWRREAKEGRRKEEGMNEEGREELEESEEGVERSGPDGSRAKARC